MEVDDSGTKAKDLSERRERRKQSSNQPDRALSQRDDLDSGHCFRCPGRSDHHSVETCFVSAQCLAVEDPGVQRIMDGGDVDNVGSMVIWRQHGIFLSW